MILEGHSGNPQHCRLKCSSERHPCLRTEMQGEYMTENMPTHFVILTLDVLSYIPVLLYGRTIIVSLESLCVHVNESHYRTNILLMSQILILSKAQLTIVRHRVRKCRC